MTESSVFPASNLFNPLDFQLNLPSSTVFVAFRPISGNRLPGNLSFCCCTVWRSVKTSAMQTSQNQARPVLLAVVPVVAVMRLSS